jgi:acyl carrier protein
MNNISKIKTEQKIINDFCEKITKKKIHTKDNLFKILDSLEIMTLISSLEHRFKIKFNMIKLLNKKKLDLLDIKNLLQ